MQGRLRVHTLPSDTDNLIWLVECVATGQCMAVDGPVADEVLARVEQLGLQFVGLLTTHTHADHIGIHRDLQRRGLLQGLRVVGYKGTASAIPGLNEPVDEGDEVQLGELQGRVMVTEGHMNGHISFVFGDAVFCGDTMFAGGCGYLFHGPPSAMFDSLLRLAELPGDTRVCCAHEYTQDNLRFALSVEPDNQALIARAAAVTELRARGGCTVPSTIDEERATNPFLRPGSPTLKASVAQAMGQELRTPLEVFTATRELKNTGAYKAR